MRYQLEIHRNDTTAVVTASGHVSIAGLVALVDLVLEHPAWRPGMNLLLELCATSNLDAAPGSGTMPKGIGRAGNVRFGDGRLALVAGSDFEAELCHLLVNALSDRTRRIVGFRKRQSALDWLAKGQSGCRATDPAKCQSGESEALPRTRVAR